jgi:heme-degrading monooxygenase HmoA
MLLQKRTSATAGVTIPHNAGAASILAMFVSISRYRVKPGMEEALRQHNEEWKLTVRPSTHGFIGVHVYKNPKDERDWTSVAMFVDEYSEMVNANSREHKLWYRRMLEMLDGPPAYWHGELVQEG